MWPNETTTPSLVDRHLFMNVLSSRVTMSACPLRRLASGRRVIGATTLACLAATMMNVSAQSGGRVIGPLPPAGPYDLPTHTQPPVVDRDYDGLSAWREAQLGTSDATSDSDGDGEGDFVEVELGTDPLDASNFTSVPPLTATLTGSGPNAPAVSVLRDDRVATVELDYVAGNPWTPFDLGADLAGPAGYRVSWWPSHLPSAVKRKVTSLRRVQIQPLLNGVRYDVRVEYVNRLGEIVGDNSAGVVHGGSDARVNTLRTEMTGFFDDFNVPEGLPDELRWNTTFSRVNDPALQAFFVNPQFHTHTAVGTPPDAFGDRGQTVHRTRTPLHLGPGETRRITFDLDGVSIGERTVWYLDLHRTNTDITSHFAIDGGAGFPGHPSPGLRFRFVGQRMSLWGFNSAGEQIRIAENSGLDWAGVQTFPNVRRTFELTVSETAAAVEIDGAAVLSADLGAFAMAPDDYTVHWTGFGYNTMKVNLPYFLLHWDNFGFDGPPSPERVHNYRVQVAGSDHGLSTNFQPLARSIMIPDALAPTDPGTQATATLRFTRQMDTFAPATWDPADTVTVGGVSFPIPEPLSTAVPTLGMSTLISANSPYSTKIELGTVGNGGTAPVVQGENIIEFRASQCGFCNVHIEIEYPPGSAPRYTSPDQLHDVPVHSDFPKVGAPARVTNIGATAVESWREHLDDPAEFQPTVSGALDIGVIVGGDFFSGQQLLRSNFVSELLASSGENPGIVEVAVSVRPDGAPASQATVIGVLATNTDCPAPQVVHNFPWDTQGLPNGVYEIYVHAVDSRGIQSFPDFPGVGQAAGAVSALNGFEFPLHVRVDN